MLALASSDFVYIIRLEPSIEIISKLIRPCVKSNDIPAIEFGKSRLYEVISDVLVISWGKSILFYKYNALNRGEKLFEL